MSGMRSAELLDVLHRAGFESLLWAPCSVTAHLESVASTDERFRFVPVTHEGNLPALAAGIWFATGRPAVVHMQNSGLTNAGDGFVSFMSPEVYGIPALALVTWRGWKPKDDSEPHLAIGDRTQQLAEVIIGRPSAVIGRRDGAQFPAALHEAIDLAQSGSLAALLVSPDVLADEVPALTAPPNVVLSPRESGRSHDDRARVTRDEALQQIVARHPNAAILFGNGYNARAAQAVVDRPGNFYNVGYMGGTLGMGWAIATTHPDLDVVVVDGDQNAQMSTFKDALSADHPANLHWYVLDNGIGASVGTARSLPLSPQIRAHATVMPTHPDAPRSFRYPRVKPHGAAIEHLPVAQRSNTLNDLARGFRLWIQHRTSNL